MPFKRLAVFVLLIVACGVPTEPTVEGPVGYTQYFEVPTPIGEIPCNSWKDGYGGGLSCDWGER